MQFWTNFLIPQAYPGRSFSIFFKNCANQILFFCRGKKLDSRWVSSHKIFSNKSDYKQHRMTGISVISSSTPYSLKQINSTGLAVPQIMRIWLRNDYFELNINSMWAECEWEATDHLNFFRLIHFDPPKHILFTNKQIILNLNCPPAHNSTWRYQNENFKNLYNCTMYIFV